jgi:hypothetical protein
LVLRYLEDDRQRKASYLRDCRSIVRCYLLPGLGADTPVENITIADIDRLRERLLRGESHHTKTAVRRTRPSRRRWCC